MTKKEALKEFKEHIWPTVRDNYGYRDDDVPAKCECWNNWTDSLCKSQEITEHQYETWSNPF